jgi:hypothetical protein
MQSMLSYIVRWHSNGILILDGFLVSSRLGIRLVDAVASEGQQPESNLKTLLIHSY